MLTNADDIGASDPMGLRQAARASQADVPLLAFVGCNDRDILPLFFAHYRRLGVAKFTLALHGAWPEAALDWVTRQADVQVWDLLGGVYEDAYRRSVLNQMAEGHRGRWVLLADADEFLELPYPTLAKTIRALEVMGLDCLPAWLLQRVSDDGRLPVLEPGRSLDEQFPLGHFGLCEDMGAPNPIWKAKYPLAKVTENFAIDRGNHLPPNPMSLAHTPIRAVVHHLKWRAALLDAFRLKRGKTSNNDEMAAYQAWLDSNASKLPVAGAKPCGREELIRRGLLVRPNRRQLLIGSALRGRRSRRATALTEERQARKLSRLLGDERDLPMATSAKSTLQGVPAKILLLTFDLSPPLTSGGIGTAMHALAEQLVAAGHELDILFCPYEGPETLWPLWYDYWANRGARLHYLPRREGEKRRYLSESEFLSKITAFLESRRFDVVHAADAAGYGASLAILRAAGLAFGNTRLVVTAHGGTAWHRRGNQFAWTEDEAEASFAEKQMLRLADVVCCPSQYMRDRLLAKGLATHEKMIVLPNALSSPTRSFGVAGGEPRPVDELVMMGRIEPRKGVDRFLQAIGRLAAAGLTGFRITFLGRAGPGVELEDIRAKLGPLGETARFITNFNHVEAVNYVKTHDCLVVISSLRENLPYSLYECLENRVPVLASDAGGMAELVAEEDRERILIAADEDRLIAALDDALKSGMRPASLAFEPSLVGLKLAALHEQLAAEARGDEEPAPFEATAAVIAYGDGPDWVADVNGQAFETDADLLFLHHHTVRPDPEALAAMERLLSRSGVGAVVVGYRRAGGAATAATLAAGGPPEQARGRNVFGAGLFLIRRSWFNRLDGFAETLTSSGLAHWDLLNRLSAAGGEVVGIPKALATVDDDMALILGRPIEPDFAERLAEAWSQQGGDEAAGGDGLKEEDDRV